LQGQVPLDTQFRDEHGRPVQLQQFFDGRRPVLLTLTYHRCTMLCSLVLNATVSVLGHVQWTLGEQFVAVNISIDPHDGPAEATQRKTELLARYRRLPAENGWHFLTGEAADSRRIADAVGFHYSFNPRDNQFAHPAAIMLLTPSGRVARYLYGLEFRPNDVTLGLLEASEGRSISTTERFLLFCYHYDPQGRKYVLVAKRIMQIGGAVTALSLGGLLTVLWVRERRRRRE